MKNKITLLTAILLMSFMGVHAQLTSGKYLLGGDINFSNEKTKDIDSKNDAAYVSFKVGKFIKDNTVFGLNLSYGHNSYRNLSSQTQETNQYGAGVFYRKYKSVAKDFHLFGEGGLNYAYSESKINYTNISNKVISNGVSLDFTPGISYSMTKKFQIELLMPNIFEIGYNNDKTTNTDPQTSIKTENTKNRFTFLANLDNNLLSNFGVGFKFILGK